MASSFNSLPARKFENRLLWKVPTMARSPQSRDEFNEFCRQL